MAIYPKALQSVSLEKHHHLGKTSSPFCPQVHNGRVTRTFAARETVDTAFAPPGLTLGLAL